MSKLNLLNEIIEDLGVKDQSFVTKVIDFFQCQFDESVSVLCIVMEYLEQSLAEYVNGEHNCEMTCSAANHLVTMEYSASDEDSISMLEKGGSPSIQSKLQKSRMLACHSQASHHLNTSTCGRTNNNGLGLSLETTRLIGF